MNPWQVLGLSPTGDLDAVKRAYAEKAKQYHPEEHPEEFQALHEAYRQASRYARQHRAPAPSAPSRPASPVPAAPRKASSNKPSFYTPSVEDNPNRTGRYRSADDEFTPRQLETMRWENKRASRAPRRPSAPALSLPKGKIPIRGAKRDAAPSGGLNFSAVEQPESDAEPEPAPSLPTAAPPEPCAPLPAKLRFPASALLVAFYLVLLPLALFLPFPAAAALFAAYFVFQAHCDQIRRSWGFTIAEALAEILLFLALDLLLWDALPSLAASGIPHRIFQALACLLPLYRLIRRVQFIRRSH